MNSFPEHVVKKGLNIFSKKGFLRGGGCCQKGSPTIIFGTQIVPPPHAQILLYAPTNKYNLIYQGVLWFENYRPDDYINERQNPLIMKLLSNENNCLLKKEKRNVKRTNGLF